VLLSGAPRTEGRQKPGREHVRVWLAFALTLVLCPPSSPHAQEGMSPEPQAENTAYEDNYLLDGYLPDIELEVASAPQPFGRRILGAELMYYSSDDDFLGEDIERGARVQWSHETQSWGVFDLEAQYADIDSSFVGRQATGGGGVVTLRQSNMAVSTAALLSTTMGHQRLWQSSVLNGGYRYRLPTSAISGFSGEVRTRDNSRIRVATGDVGAYRGVRIPQFQKSGGRLTTVAYEHALNDELELGAELVLLNGDDRVRDHTSMLLATRHTTPDDTWEHAARLLADDDGNIALWIDGLHEFGTDSSFRYGAFSIDPDLVWASLPISNDQRGAYARASIGNARYSLSGGYDYFETGLGSDALASTLAHAVFFSGNLRLRRSFSLGLNTGFTNRSFISKGDNQVLYRVNAFANIGSSLGNTRLEVFSYDLDSELVNNQRSQTGVAASFNWRMPQKIRLTTELRVENNQGQTGDARRSELAALFRYDLFDGITFGLNSRLYKVHGESNARDTGSSLSAEAGWAFLPNWYASLSVNRNETDFQWSGSNFLDAGGSAGQSSFWLTARYERHSGRPYPTVGHAHNGMSGSGQISGYAFFDANRDSIRQPSEDVAVGAVVLLDGRFETRTDEQGRYSFAPVPTGAHELSVLVEDLPLPSIFR
jgi:hypothetical protein